MISNERVVDILKDAESFASANPDRARTPGLNGTAVSAAELIALCKRWQQGALRAAKEERWRT